MKQTFIIAACLLIIVMFLGTHGGRAVVVETREPSSISIASVKQAGSGAAAHPTAATTGVQRAPQNPLLNDLFSFTAQANAGDEKALHEFLATLDQKPLVARKMISDGLSTLPISASLERAGLLDLVPRFAEGDRQWAVETLERELIEVPSAPRIAQRNAKTAEERNAALNVTPDILRTHLAAENLITLLKRDCARLGLITKQILTSQKDELLRQNFAIRVNYECPSIRAALPNESEI